jgi:phosphoribosylamine-glycine ligase
MIKLLALLGIFHLRKAQEPDVEETALYRQRLEAVISRARVVDMGGRSACVVGLGDNLTEAQTRALVRWNDRAQELA